MSKSMELHTESTANVSESFNISLTKYAHTYIRGHTHRIEKRRNKKARGGLGQKNEEQGKR